MGDAILRPVGKLEQPYGRVAREFEEIIGDIVTLLVCHAPRRKMFRRREPSGAGVQSAAVREQQDLIEGVIQLGARNVRQVRSALCEVARAHKPCARNIPGLMNRSNDRGRIIRIVGERMQYLCYLSRRHRV